MTIRDKKIFSVSALAPIFQSEKENSDKLISRENSTLEFKESFNWENRAKYAKTMAAFSNAKGGYIVFGVTNCPRKAKGLNDDRFERIDPARIAEYLNEYFNPEIEWEIGTHEFLGKKFGLIYIFESENKPVICSKSSSDTTEGAIYYRYRGRSQAIKYAELSSIIREQRSKDQETILQHIKKIGDIGVRNTAILDINTGLTQGAAGAFIIDESLLPKIKFIKEGHFVENSSIPAMKLIGKVETINGVFIKPTRKITFTKAIRTPDIFEAFYDQKLQHDSLEYIKQVAFESSANLPLHYFISKSGLKIEEIYSIIENLNTRGQTKKHLLQRLKKDYDFSYSKKETKHPSSPLRLKRLSELQSKKCLTTSFNNKDDLYIALRAVRMLQKNEFNKKYLLGFLKDIFNKYYQNSSSAIANEIRMATCHIDNILNT